MAQSVGIIGGRPNHAIYFFGHQGDILHGLDPHTTQPTPEFDATPRPDAEGTSADARMGNSNSKGGEVGDAAGSESGVDGGRSGSGSGIGVGGGAGAARNGSEGGAFIPSDAHLRSVQVPSSPTCMHVERLDPVC